MKKLLFFLLLLVVSVCGRAQEPSDSDSIQVIDMNRTFSFGGHAVMCLRSNQVTKKSIQPLEWTLKNDRIGDSNIVMLEVKNRKTGELIAHQIWNGNVLVRIKTNKGKPELYEVYDEMFAHLRILDVGIGTGIFFYSELLKK